MAHVNLKGVRLRTVQSSWSPEAFHRIRFYGFMHARAKEKLDAMRARLGVARPEGDPPATQTEAPPTRCPKCGEAMRLVAHRSRAPPHLRTIPEVWFQAKRQNRARSEPEHRKSAA